MENKNLRKRLQDVEDACCDALGELEEMRVSASCGRCGWPRAALRLES